MMMSPDSYIKACFYLVSSFLLPRSTPNHLGGAPEKVMCLISDKGVTKRPKCGFSNVPACRNVIPSNLGKYSLKPFSVFLVM